MVGLSTDSVRGRVGRWAHPIVLGMNPKLSNRAEAYGGVFSHTDVLACGYTEGQLRERLKAGAWMRLRRGYYAARPDLERCQPTFALNRRAFH